MISQPFINEQSYLSNTVQDPQPRKYPIEHPAKPSPDTIAEADTIPPKRTPDPKPSLGQRVYLHESTVVWPLQIAGFGAA